MIFSAEEYFHVTQLIRATVRDLGTVVVNDGRDDFDVALLPLKEPRVIGEHTATHIRLASAKSGSLAAAATYQHTPATLAPGEPGAGLPVRHIVLPSEGNPRAVWDGSMDANAYELPRPYWDDLVSDITSSL